MNRSFLLLLLPSPPPPPPLLPWYRLISGDRNLCKRRGRPLVIYPLPTCTSVERKPCSASARHPHCMLRRRRLTSTVKYVRMKRQESAEQHVIAAAEFFGAVDEELRKVRTVLACGWCRGRGGGAAVSQLGDLFSIVSCAAAAMKKCGGGVVAATSADVLFVTTVAAGIALLVSCFVG